MSVSYGVHFPPGLAGDLKKQTPPGQTMEWTIEQALQRFLLLNASTRLEFISAYWWGAIRKGSWEKLYITDATWKLARACKVGAWSVEQVLTAACEWFVKESW